MDEVEQAKLALTGFRAGVSAFADAFNEAGFSVFDSDGEPVNVAEFAELCLELTEAVGNVAIKFLSKE